jgi:hypothetical protein
MFHVVEVIKKKALRFFYMFGDQITVTEHHIQEPNYHLSTMKVKRKVTSIVELRTNVRQYSNTFHVFSYYNENKSRAYSCHISLRKSDEKLFRQRAVLEFLKEEIHATDIHTQLKPVYGDARMGASSTSRCVKHFKYGNTHYADEPRSCRP